MNLYNAFNEQLVRVKRAEVELLRNHVNGLYVFHIQTH